MPKGKADAAIGLRATEFIESLPYDRLWKKLFACGVQDRIYRGWKKGLAPSAMYLQKLANKGTDVYYILTGKRIEE